MADKPPQPPLPRGLSAILNSPSATAKTISFKDLLVGDGPPPKAVVIRTTPQPITIKRPKLSLPITVFQDPIPKPCLLSGEGGETWSLRCFCDSKVEQGFMIQCEKCENWQHAKCVNITRNTLPEKYICPICSHIHIRCSCNENMDYTIPLIKCTKCQYYVHRECEGLNVGPVNTETFVCSKCEGTPQNLPNVCIKNKLPYPNPKINLTSSTVESLHPSIQATPLYPVMMEKLLGKDLYLYKFLETTYNNLRPFFYMTHQYVSFSSIKKKKIDVSSSFFKALLFIVNKLYHVTSDKVIGILDEIAKIDLYLPFPPIIPEAPMFSEKLDFSDNAFADFAKFKHAHEISNPTIPSSIYSTASGVFTNAALPPEQLVCIVRGYTALVDEFLYDHGIDPRYISAYGTKFVVDTGTAPQFAKNFRRSLNPNCALRFFKYRGEAYAGIFAGVSEAVGIDNRARRGKFSVPENTELTIPIDFPPGWLAEPLDYMAWHFDDAETEAPEPPSSPPPRAEKEVTKRSRSSADERFTPRPVKEKPKKKLKEPKEKSKRKQAKIAQKPTVDPNDALIFNIFKQSDVREFFFKVTESAEEEEMMEEDKSEELETVETADDVPDYNEEPDLSFLDELRSVPDISYHPIDIGDPMADYLAILRENKL